MRAGGATVAHLHAHVFGLIAQLVERFYGIEEVRGSNPLGSTGFQTLARLQHKGVESSNLRVHSRQ